MIRRRLSLVYTAATLGAVFFALGAPITSWG